jgi:hypothetical protein
VRCVTTVSQWSCEPERKKTLKLTVECFRCSRFAPRSLFNCEIRDERGNGREGTLTNDLDAGAVPRSPCEGRVPCNKRGIERFGKSDVSRSVHRRSGSNLDFGITELFVLPEIGYGAAGSRIPTLFTCRGNDRRAIFRDHYDRTRFLERLRSALEIFRVRVHACILMSNHFHLIVETPKAW